ncbi:hypothetical protein B7494_g817 [Chlorociboria aeruginascens]|nr:hypothetical protein B7494_g817 [Chlorociboria aeruginascens]
MSIPTNPTRKSPERAFALQKYLLLHSQHDALQKHLEEIASSPTTTPSSPSSPSSSPDRHHQHRQSLSSSPPSLSPSQQRHHHRSSTAGCSGSGSHRYIPGTRRASLPPIIDDSTADALASEESKKLKDVNMQIKNTLTELLNCESVRSDTRYRKWIQTRLMDAERELKEERSRSCEKMREEGLVV